ncbi:MAG: transposase [Candidatus Poribacteria bacterium]|nr:transposase [Candidatus Poribacteria bacterium]
MAKRRRFTPEFKAEVVLEALSDQSSQAELCRRHNISDVQLSKWKRQLLEMRRPPLNLLISRRMRLKSVLLNLNNLLAN